jgi:hypothetical protein
MDLEITYCSHFVPSNMIQITYSNQLSCTYHIIAITMETHGQEYVEMYVCTSLITIL